jgi:UDP-N-acetylmuramyl tripeptide synthase
MVCQHIYNCLTAADTTVLVAVREMEPSGAQAIRDLFESKGKSIWFIGPILSKAVNGDPKPVTPSASVVLSFLDRMQSTRGAQSVLYVSQP